MDFDPDELLKIAVELVDLGKQNGVTLRLLGHQSVRYHVQHHRDLIDQLKRLPTHDIDFMGYSSEQSRADQMFIDQLGYKPDPVVMHSQEFGIQRLIYYHDNGIMAEIFLDQLRMSHTLDFKGRLELDTPTISLVDILLSKLQIQQINEKDIKDLIVLIAEHDLGSGDREKIDLRYLLQLTRDDWGLYKTASTNLGRVNEFAGFYEVLDAATRQIVMTRLATLQQRMEVEPKTIKWKARARIGTRMRWYEEVEEVDARGS